MPALKNTAGSRRCVKYTENPFLQDEVKAKTPSNQQIERPLFNVPNDLCKRFFDLAFQDTTDSIDIGALFRREDDDMSQDHHGATAPPSISLMLTCRRIFDECKTAFDSASSTYWKKDFIIKVDDDPNVPRSLTSVPDNFVAHIRTYKVIVTLEGMPVAITLRAKTDGNWYLDASRPTGDSNNHLTSLETSLKERLSELQAPKDARKAFQRGRPHDSAFKAFTTEGLQDLLF